MYRRARITALVALVTAAQLGAQGTRAVRQQGTAAATTKAAINKVWDDAVATFKTGDASAIAAMYTPDAVMIDPAMATVTGRANIEKVMKGMFATTKLVGMTHKSDGISVIGDVAIDNGTYEQTLQEKGKAPMTVRARYTLVFTQVEGKWLVHRDVSTPLPPAPSPAAKK